MLPKIYRTFRLHFDGVEPKILVIARFHETALPDDPEDNPSVLDIVGESRSLCPEFKHSYGRKNG